ncbi:MAG TPA: DoxX family protein, partial [Actinomycetota bacterium]|nr:DoxX family protein [Actinomycetota bacterium]
MMITAIATVHLGKGPWAASGGWELNATNIAAAAVVAFAGPGRYSLDGLAGWDLYGLQWGAAAVGAAAVTSLLTLATRRRRVPVEAVATQSQAA